MKKFLHYSITVKILLLAVIICLSYPLPPGAQAEPNRPVEIKITLDKPVYAAKDIIKASITLTKTTTGTVPPLRVYVALKDRTGKTLAYRNRYVSSFQGSQAFFQLSFNTANLKISAPAYTLEASVFARSKPITSARSLIVFSINPQPLEIAYLINYRLPFRLNDGEISDEAPLNFLIEKNSTLQLIKFVSERKIPVIVAVPSSTIIQLEKMTRGFWLKTKESKKEFNEESPQAKIAKDHYEALKTLLLSPQTNLCLYPFGEANPVLLYKNGLAEEIVERYEKSRTIFRQFQLESNFTGFVFLPDKGISGKVVDELSKNGYLLLVEKKDKNQKSGLYQNTIVLVAEKIKNEEASQDFVFNLLENHLRTGGPELFVFDITDLNPQQFAEIDNELRKYPFVKVVNSPPFSLKPLNTFVDVEPDYGNFNSLLSPLINNYKKAKMLYKAYTDSFVIDDTEKTELNAMLENAFSFALNPPNEFDQAFRLLKQLQEKIISDFKKVKIYPTKISFTSTKAQLPVTIFNKTGKPVKARLEIKATGLLISNNKNDIIVLKSEENVIMLPIKLNKAGTIKANVVLKSLSGYPITRGTITVTSNYKLILISTALLLLVLIAVLLWFRKRLMRKLKNV